MTWETFRQEPKLQAHTALPEREQRRLFAAHCDRLYDRRCAAFAEYVATHYPLQQQWTAELATALPHVPVYRALGLTDPEGRKLFAHLQAQRMQEADRRFQELLGECAFLAFHVKHALLSLHGASAALTDAAMAAAAAKPALLSFPAEEAEEAGASRGLSLPSPPSFGAEGRYISLADIYAVLRTDARFLDTPEQRTAVEGYVVGLLERYRAERGGTLDKVIAAHAGAAQYTGSSFP
jgi:hypothetical protein